MDEVKTFKNWCNDLSADISDLSGDLNESTELNVNEDISRITEVFLEIHEKRKDLALEEKDKKEIDEILDKLKDDCVALKNKHIERYNEKVKFINQRITDLTTNTSEAVLSDNVKEMIDKLEILNECEVFVNGDWKQSIYLNTLNYDKLDEMYKNVSDVEIKLRIKTDEPMELWASWNYVNETIKSMNKEVKDDMDLSDINLLLNKCVSLVENIIDLDIRHEIKRDELSKEMFSKYSGKISRLNSSLKTLELDLLERKNNVGKDKNDYTVTCNYLEQLEKKYNVVSKKVSEYRGKCTDKTIVRFNNFLKEYQKDLVNIKNQIEEYKNNGTLDDKQIENLDKKINKMQESHNNVSYQVNVNPFMLKGVDDVLYFNMKMNELDDLLTQLDNKVRELEGPVKDKNVRKEFNTLIKERENDIKRYNDKLLEFYKDKEPKKYETLKAKLDIMNDKFDSTCKEYRGKCPLRVKCVKSAKQLFKKYKKISLISAGLSLLTMTSRGVASTLIPAIMYGNTMMGKKIPGLAGYSNFTNDVLGSFIGAKKNDNVWILSDGRKINSDIVSTVLLKTLSVCGVGIVGLISPILLGIKKINHKMKIAELKYEKSQIMLKNTVDQNDLFEKNKHKKIEDRISNLLYEYKKSGMTLDLFLDSHKLTEEEIEILEANVKQVGRR